MLFYTRHHMEKIYDIHNPILIKLEGVDWDTCDEERGGI